MSELSGVKTGHLNHSGGKKIPPEHNARAKADESTAVKEEPNIFKSFAGKTCCAAKNTANMVSLLNPVNLVFYFMAQKMSSIFFPFIDLVNGLDNPAGNKTKVTAKEYAKTLDTVLSAITSEQELMKIMTPKSRESLTELKETVAELEQRSDLQDLDMTELIHKWRHEKDTEAIFELSKRFRTSSADEKCPGPIDKKMRVTFADVLESLAHANKEVLKHPPSKDRDRAYNHVLQATDGAVDASECYVKKGSVEKLTNEDKQFISTKLEDVSEHVETVTKDKSLAKYLGSAYDLLCNLVNEIKEFLEWWEKYEEEEKQKKLCEERHAKKQEIKKLCHRHKVEKVIADRLYYRMEEIKQKMSMFYRMKEDSKQKFGISSKKYQLAHGEFRKNVAEYSQALKIFKEKVGEEFYFKTKEEETYASMPSSDVCGPQELYSLELDLVC